MLECARNISVIRLLKAIAGSHPAYAKQGRIVWPPNAWPEKIWPESKVKMQQWCVALQQQLANGLGTKHVRSVMSICACHMHCTCK